MITARCPGKVILLGEYSVMAGGPALVGAVAPYFELHAQKVLEGGALVHPFAAPSPAGLLCSQFVKRFGGELEGVRLKWVDPYATPIGVGSSSAQFVLTYRVLSKILGLPPADAEHILQDYWDIVGDTQGLRPSGADVVSQLEGGVIHFVNEPFACQPLQLTIEGKFAGRFLLAFTGSKMRTHEHLKSLALRGYPGAFEPMFARMNAITAKGVAAWTENDVVAFGASLNAYQDVMNEFELSKDPVVRAVTAARHWPGVLGCKGSGAQGGDCALLLIREAAHESIVAKARSEGWQTFDVEWAI